MERVLEFLSGSLVGAGLLFVGYFLLVPCQGIVLASRRLDGPIGLVLLAVGIYLSLFVLSERGPTDSGRSSGGLDADTQRLAKLLSQLEQLRVHANLPEKICSKLEEEYTERLRVALEKSIG